MAAQYRRSGLTIGEFVRQTGVSRRMVLYWTQRERELAANVQAGFADVTAAIPAPSPVLAVAAPEQQSPRASDPVQPVLPSVELPSPTVMTAVTPPVVVTGEPLAAPSSRQSAVEIRLPGGATIAVGRDFDPQTLRAVVGCLVAPC
jgi:hypothetical protein